MAARLGEHERDGADRAARGHQRHAHVGSESRARRGSAGVHRRGRARRRSSAGMLAIIAGLPVRITSCTPPRGIRIRRDTAAGARARTRPLPDRRGRRPAAAASPASSTMSTAHQSAISGTASCATAARVCFVIERARQDGRRVGEERRLTRLDLRRLRCARCSLVQFGGRQGGGGEVRERLAGLHVHLAERMRGAVVEDERACAVGCPTASGRRAWTGSLRRDTRPAVRPAAAGRRRPRPAAAPGKGGGRRHVASVGRDHAAGECRRHTFGLRRPASGAGRDRSPRPAYPSATSSCRASDMVAERTDSVSGELEQRGGRVHQQRQPPVELRTFGLVPLAGADIARNLGGPDDAPVRILDGRHLRAKYRRGCRPCAAAPFPFRPAAPARIRASTCPLPLRRSGGTINVIDWPIASASEIAEHPFGAAVPRHDDRRSGSC